MTGGVSIRNGGAIGREIGGIDWIRWGTTHEGKEKKKELVG